jgi:hypothetical protein
MPTDHGKKPSTSPREGVEEQIRLRAYQLYEERGRENGHEVEDWLRAEEEIKGNRTAVAA